MYTTATTVPRRASWARRPALGLLAALFGLAIAPTLAGGQATADPAGRSATPQAAPQEELARERFETVRLEQALVRAERTAVLLGELELARTREAP